MNQLILIAVYESLNKKKERLKELSEIQSKDAHLLAKEVIEMTSWLNEHEQPDSQIKNSVNVAYTDNDMREITPQRSQAVNILKDHLEKLIKGHEQSRLDYNKRCEIQQEWAQSLKKEAETIERLKCEIDFFERGWKVL